MTHLTPLFSLLLPPLFSLWLKELTKMMSRSGAKWSGRSIWHTSSSVFPPNFLGSSGFGSLTARFFFGLLPSPSDSGLLDIFYSLFCFSETFRLCGRYFLFQYYVKVNKIRIKRSETRNENGRSGTERDARKCCAKDIFCLRRKPSGDIHSSSSFRLRFVPLALIRGERGVRVKEELPGLTVWGSGKTHEESIQSCRVSSLVSLVFLGVWNVVTFSREETDGHRCSETVRRIEFCC